MEGFSVFQTRQSACPRQADGLQADRQRRQALADRRGQGTGACAAGSSAPNDQGDKIRHQQDGDRR